MSRIGTSFASFQFPELTSGNWKLIFNRDLAARSASFHGFSQFAVKTQFFALQLIEIAEFPVSGVSTPYGGSFRKRTAPRGPVPPPITTEGKSHG